jgi:hypothetical protein
MSDLILADSKLKHVRNSPVRILHVDNGRTSVFILDSKSCDTQFVLTEKDRLDLRLRSLCGDGQVRSGPNCEIHPQQYKQRDSHNRAS